MSKINIEEIKENGIQVYEKVHSKNGGAKRFTNEYLMYKMKEVYQERGEVRSSYFKATNGLPSHAVYIKRFGSFVSAMKEASIPLSSKQQEFYDSRSATDEFLLRELKRCNKELGFPTSSKLKPSNGFPSMKVYCNRFKTMENALNLAGIEIPKDKLNQYGNNRRARKTIKMTNEDLLEMLKYHTNEKLETQAKLLTYADIDNIEGMPHSSTLINKFGSLKQAYKLIDIDVDEFNKQRMKEKMTEDYHNLAKELGRTPTVYDLNDACTRNNGETMSGTTYRQHFGSISQLKAELGYDVYQPAKFISDEDALKMLWELGQEVGRAPTWSDIGAIKTMPSTHHYRRRFGTLAQALFEAGFSRDEAFKNQYTTKQGNHCFSSYEFDFCTMLEKYSFNFKKEEMYKDYIEGLDTKIRCDFTLFLDDEIYFIEVFGIDSNDRNNYNERTKNKIDVVKGAGLKLIEFYPEHFINKTQDDIYNELIKQIESFNK